MNINKSKYNYIYIVFSIISIKATKPNNLYSYLVIQYKYKNVSHDNEYIYMDGNSLTTI